MTTLNKYCFFSLAFDLKNDLVPITAQNVRKTLIAFLKYE